MEEYFDPNADPDTLELVKRFEEMVDSRGQRFFDVDEFEEIIDYYQFRGDLKAAFRALRHGLDQHPEASGLMLKKRRFTFIPARMTRP